MNQRTGGVLTQSSSPLPITLTGWNKNSSSQVILGKPNAINQNSTQFDDMFVPQNETQGAADT
jgi:hypothetical protein